jgi:hypothetical protein
MSVKYKESGVLIQKIAKEAVGIATGVIQTGFIDFGDVSYKKKIYSVSIKIKSADEAPFLASYVKYAINNTTTYNSFSKMISNQSASSMGEYETSISLATDYFVQYDFFPSSKIRCNTISLQITIPAYDISISEISIHYAPLEKSSYEK